MTSALPSAARVTVDDAPPAYQEKDPRAVSKGVTQFCVLFIASRNSSLASSVVCQKCHPFLSFFFFFQAVQSSAHVLLTMKQEFARKQNKMNVNVVMNKIQWTCQRWGDSRQFSTQHFLRLKKQKKTQGRKIEKRGTNQNEITRLYHNTFKKEGKKKMLSAIILFKTKLQEMLTGFQNQLYVSFSYRQKTKQDALEQ